MGPSSRDNLVTSSLPQVLLPLQGANLAGVSPWLPVGGSTIAILLVCKAFASVDVKDSPRAGESVARGQEETWERRRKLLQAPSSTHPCCCTGKCITPTSLEPWQLAPLQSPPTLPPPPSPLHLPPPAPTRTEIPAWLLQLLIFPFPAWE